MQAKIKVQKPGELSQVLAFFIFQVLYMASEHWHNSWNFILDKSEYSFHILFLDECNLVWSR